MKWPKLKQYYMIEESDGPLERLQKRLTRRAVPPFPRALQIQTHTGCQADCMFCPYGATYHEQPKGRMPLPLFESILEEAARHGVRRISPYLMNEPFGDHELLDRIGTIKKIHPDCKVVLTTNGGLLRRELADHLLDRADDVHAVYVSFQGIEKKGYEATMRGAMRFERTLDNVNYLIEEQRRRRLDRPKIWITMVDTELIDAPTAVDYWRKRGVRAKYTTLENRGGNIEAAQSLAHHEMDYYTTCTRLFRQGYVMFNGDMVICCTDYSREMVIGNVAESSVHDVWNGPVARDVRNRYLNGGIGTLPLCSVCKVDQIREVTN